MLVGIPLEKEGWTCNAKFLISLLESRPLPSRIHLGFHIDSHGHNVSSLYRRIEQIMRRVSASGGSNETKFASVGSGVYIQYVQFSTRRHQFGWDLNMQNNSFSGNGCLTNNSPKTRSKKKTKIQTRSFCDIIFQVCQCCWESCLSCSVPVIRSLLVSFAALRVYPSPYPFVHFKLSLRSISRGP